MVVTVESDADCQMSWALLRDLRVDANQQQVRGVAVPRIREARGVFHPANQVRELVRQAAPLHRLPIGASANQRVAGVTDTEYKEALGLLPLQPAKLLDREGRPGAAAERCAGPMTMVWENAIYVLRLFRPGGFRHSYGDGSLPTAIPPR